MGFQSQHVSFCGLDDFKEQHQELEVLLLRSLCRFQRAENLMKHVFQKSGACRNQKRACSGSTDDQKFDRLEQNGQMSALEGEPTEN